MKALKVILTVCALVAVGFLVCPPMPGRERVDPDRLLKRLLESNRTTPSGTNISYLPPNPLPKREGELELPSPDWRGERKLPSPNRGGIGGEVNLIRRNYTPLVEGEDVISGRPAWTLRLKPKRRHHPWKQLWVDKETGAVLAERDWSSRNKLKRSMKVSKRPRLR